MDNPLRYQMTEYDCGPTSMLNAVSYLFRRDEIPPELTRNIMLYCLDCFGEDGSTGRRGTSRMAMMFLSNWLNGFGKIGRLHISTQYLSGIESLSVGPGGELLPERPAPGRSAARRRGGRAARSGGLALCAADPYRGRGRLSVRPVLP